MILWGCLDMFVMRVNDDEFVKRVYISDVERQNARVRPLVKWRDLSV